MVAATYDAAMVRVYADEGGFSDDKYDPGSWTNYGITIFDARMYAAEFGWIVGRQVTRDDMKAMPKWFAAKVYAEKYAKPMRYNDLPAGVDYSVLDAAINSGVGRAPKWLATALKIGPAPIAALVKPANDNPDKVSLIQRYWNTRLAFLHSLSTWSHFGPGWGRRVANGEAAAVKMWLTIGAQLPAPEVKKTMNDQAPKAKAQAKKTATGAATAGGGGGAAAPTVDWSQLGHVGGKVAMGLIIGLAVVLVVYFVRNTLIHNQRAAAYAAA